MAYEVLARKWRPQQFEDVVGQEHVTDTLRNAIEGERIAHAYLFVGPRGIGKTTIARIFAKALNCEKGPAAVPCDTCESCRQIMAGGSLDVLEIDGASNNGVDQVRDLRNTVQYKPVQGTYKIYIIDEVHMLSNAAFNALLKTLEEPPEYVKFFFATTEPDKILPTIISRCQRFDLRRIPVTQIAERLRLIADAESIKVEDEALVGIARGAEGGMRDAQSALDQLIAFCGKSITEEDVLSVFGLVSGARIEELAANVLAGDIKAVIACVGELDASGKNMRRLLIELLHHFRNLLVCLHVDDPGTESDMTPRQIEVVKAQAEGTDTDRVLRIADILVEAEERLKFALSPRVLLETALIRCARAATVVSLNEVLRQLNALKQGLGAQASGGSLPQPEPDRPGGDGSGGPQRTGSSPTAKPPVRDPKPPDTPAHELTAEQAERQLATLQERWHEIAERAGRISVLAKSALLDGRPTAVAMTHVTVKFSREFEDSLRNAESTRSKRALEHVLGEVLNRSVAAHLEVGAPGEVADPGVLTAAVTGPADAPGGGDAPEGDDGEVGPDALVDEGETAPQPPLQPTLRPPARGTDRRVWMGVEEVRRAIDIFDGRLIEVRS